jgi:hypothetical protein
MDLSELGPVRVFYSALDPTYVSELVAFDYDVGSPSDCRLLYAGHNDTYEVVVGDSRYAFRLHTRDKWWLAGESDVRYELELLTHLHAHGAPVSYPLPRRNGDLLGTLTAPEGSRFYSLFSWAPGAPVDVEVMSASQARVVGKALATIHVAADGHAPTHRRYVLDERTLLDRSLETLAAELAAAGSEDRETVEGHVGEIRSALATFDPGPTGWGIIHGDIQALNYHFDDSGAITVFDFDCAYGDRSRRVGRGRPSGFGSQLGSGRVGPAGTRRAFGRGRPQARRKPTTAERDGCVVDDRTGPTAGGRTTSRITTRASRPRFVRPFWTATSPCGRSLTPSARC